MILNSASMNGNVHQFRTSWHTCNRHHHISFCLALVNFTGNSLCAASASSGKIRPYVRPEDVDKNDPKTSYFGTYQFKFFISLRIVGFVRFFLLIFLSFSFRRFDNAIKQSRRGHNFVRFLTLGCNISFSVSCSTKRVFSSF